MKQKEEKTKKRYAMVVELKKCFNCKGCVVACRAENNVPLPISRNWIDESLQGTNGGGFEIQLACAETVIDL